MGGVITKEQDISQAQYLELVYSQSGTLYDLISHAPRPTSNPSIPSIEPLVDGVLGFVQTQSMAKSSKKKKQPTTPASQTISNPKTASPPVVSTEVNAFQSSEYLGGNKKGKNKSEKYENQQEGNKT